MDLQGHSSNNRLTIFMYKPAPIQITWLGQGSTGIPEIDYFIGSTYLNPKSEDDHYIEKVLRLPRISQCFTPPDFDIKINELPFLKNKFITFGGINKIIKINDEVIKLWSKILLSIPNSKLFLKNRDLDDKKIVENLYLRFKKNNIEKNRLIFSGEVKTRKDLLQFYNHIDISLDPFPFQGHTNTVESIWMGVPVLVLKGNRYLFHFGENINSNLNMQDWIAKNQEEYISKAIKFSSDIKYLTSTRMNLRSTLLNSAICDSSQLSENLSNLLWEVWNGYLKKIK